MASSSIEIVRRAHELVRHFDDRVFDCFAADAVLEWPFAPPALAKRYDGRDAIRALLAPRYAAMRAAGRQPIEYRRMAIHELTDPSALVVEIETDAGLGFIQVFRVVRGAIALQRDYFDSLAMAERLRV